MIKVHSFSVDKCVVYCKQRKNLQKSSFTHFGWSRLSLKVASNAVAMSCTEQGTKSSSGDSLAIVSSTTSTDSLGALQDRGSLLHVFIYLLL